MTTISDISNLFVPNSSYHFMFNLVSAILKLKMVITKWRSVGVWLWILGNADFVLLLTKNNSKA